MPGTGTTLTPTHCRICEPLCPLVAETDGDGTVVAIHPDREHPVSGGFACHKGTSFGAVHHDPNRLDHPLLADEALGLQLVQHALQLARLLLVRPQLALQLGAGMLPAAEQAQGPSLE